MTFRRRYQRPLALGPAHGESVVDSPPGDINASFIRRECSVFSGVGSELVEREPDGLCGSSREAQPGAMNADTRTNEIGEVRELGTNQVLDLDPLPSVSDEEVLIG